MIVPEIITIGDSDFVRTLSDRGVYIERDGVKYVTALDPVEENRVYTETDEPVAQSSDI